MTPALSRLAQEDEAEIRRIVTRLSLLEKVAEAAILLRQSHAQLDGTFYRKSVYEGSQIALDEAIACMEVGAS